MKMPRQEDFAILLMGELACHYRQRLVSLNQIAHTHGVSMLFLKKIARLLKRAGLTESKEGKGGGYFLTKKPQEVTLWDILQAVSPRSPDMSIEASQRKFCPLYKDCLPQKIRKTVAEITAKSFASVTLADLLKGSFSYEKQY